MSDHLDPDSILWPDDGFADWLRKFNSGRNQRQCGAVYDALDRVERKGACTGWPDHDFPAGAVWMLRYLALRACWFACTYLRDHEPDDAIRARVDYRAQVEKVREAIPALHRLATIDPEIADAFSKAREILDGVIAAAEAALPDKPLAPDRYKRRELCLAWYADPRIKTNLTTRAAALAFNLEHLFRQYTGAGRVMGHGVALPTTGNACRTQACRIAAEVCNDDARKIAERLKKLRATNPLLIPWPTPRQK